MSGFSILRGLVAFTLVASVGCAGLLADVAPVESVVACVLQHDSQPPAAIAEACAGVTVDGVIAILNAQKAAEAKHIAAKLCE